MADTPVYTRMISCLNCGHEIIQPGDNPIAVCVRCGNVWEWEPKAYRLLAGDLGREGLKK